MAGGQAMIDIVEDILALDVHHASDRIVLKEPTPHARVPTPETHDLFVQASRPPMALHEMLITF
jgi:hypothetical protein